MSDPVRVQVKEGDEWRTLAQLDEAHAKQYLEDIQSDNFDAAMMLAINNDRTALKEKAESITELKSLIDNAIFMPENFRIIPCEKVTK